MIAKRVPNKHAKPRAARLVQYIVDAEGSLDPRSWERTADYILCSKTNKYGEKVGGVRVTNCNTDDPAAATTLIEVTQAANTRSKTDKTYHLLFSFPPGEEPPIEVLHKIEDELVEAIGFTGHQRISAVHIDKKHLHVHVAINKVRQVGKNFNNIEPWYDKNSLMEACDAIEIKYKLQRTNHGLTGEKKREKHNAIRLEPQHGIDANTRKQLHKSHILASALGSERENNHGMPELPGGNVAHIERGYSELLPGDARDRVLSQREKHPDSLRRQGDGAGRAGTRLNDKVAQAEAHSSIDTLTGYIKREVAPKLKEAKTWKETHSLAAEHGLEIKLRGAGLVIGSGELWARASQCDRDLSFKKMTDRLGPFEKAQTKAKKPFEPKPQQAHPLSGYLYEQYQREKQRALAQRNHSLDRIKYEGAMAEAQLQQWRMAQRAAIKASSKGLARRASLAMIRLHTKTMRDRNRKAIEAKRRNLMSLMPVPTWVGWLTQNAQAGNVHALSVLRSKQEREAMNGNCFTAPVINDKSNIVIPRMNPYADKNGYVSYKTMDGGLVLDHKHHVQSLRTTAGAAQMALELAAKRFDGQALIVEGHAEFKAEVARLAGVRGVNVRFSDPEMEKIRTAAIQPKERGKSINKGREL